MAYKLYYSPGAASLAVHWMLLELGVPFEAQAVELGGRDDAYFRLNPLGRVPTLIVDGIPTTESAALLMLLAERHPEAGLAPRPGVPARAQWLELHAYLTSTLAPSMRDWFYADTDGDPAGAPAVRDLARRRIEEVWSRLDDRLGDGRPYMMGETLTTTDFQAAMLMRWSRNMAHPATEFARLGPYIVRLRAREAFAELCRREGLEEWLNV